MSAPMHWAADLIGAPWDDVSTNGPNSFDCRGLVRECVRRRGLPDLPEVEEAAGSDWRLVPDGQEDDVVTMRGPEGAHIAFMVRANGRLGVLHANGYRSSEGPVGFVEFQPLATAKANGYGRIKFWRAECKK